MGRKDASTARTPVDQYRKQIGKRWKERLLCLNKACLFGFFFPTRPVNVTKCVIPLQKVCVACEWCEVMHTLGKHFLYALD